MRKLFAVLCLASSCSFALAQSGYAVTRAYADGKGLVHIVTADGKDFAILPEKGQDGVGNIKVAPDGVTVGWLVDLWESCCVSYSIPTELVVWRSGRILLRIHWGWPFGA
jgi:hypothetical protein